MKNKLSLSLILVVTLFISLLTLVLIRTFAPFVILPKFDVSNIAILSLIALVINHYLNDEDINFYSIGFAFVAFGILPFASGFVSLVDALLLALKGGITFTVLMFIFSSIQDRLTINGKKWFTPLITAFMLFLVVQFLIGII